jgi:SPP1 family phage portal protein
MYDASYKYSFKGSMTTRPASARTVDPDIISVQWELIDKTLHYFDGVPLLKWRNNDSEKGDAENVLSLIDLYDETVSDLAAENEQFRLAYMVFKGQKPELETLDALKRTGALWMGGDNDEVSFLTKTVEATSIFTFLTKLEGNILHFAQSINLREEAFAGNLSGVALSYKTRNFENNCKTTELENKASLREMWRLILAMWKLKNIGDWDYTDLQFNFVRNYPRNTLEESQTTMNLKGMVSEQTRLSQLSFVEDAVAEEEQMKKETEGLIDISMLRDKMTQNTDSEEIEDGVQTEETKTTEKIKLKRPVKRPTE